MKKIIAFVSFLLLIRSAAFSQVPVEEPHSPLTDTSANKIYSVYETEPLFPGGNAAWTKYLRQNLNMSVPLSRKASPGSYKVVIKYVVEIDGSISNITAETNAGYGMEEEAMRVIRRAPKWLPATIGGKPVRAYRRQPVAFMVMN